MVRIKQKPRHPEVWPPKCVVYMSRNHTSYSDIRSYFTRTKQPGTGRNRINTRGMSTLPQWKIQLPLRPHKLLIAYVTRLQPFIVGGDSFREHVEALISYNLRNNGYQQDCIYIEQGHLITPTFFMMHSMAIDPWPLLLYHGCLYLFVFCRQRPSPGVHRNYHLFFKIKFLAVLGLF